MTSRLLLFLLLAAGLVFTGCGGRPNLAEVKGQLLIDGEPAEGVEICYVPDPEFENKGRFSKGITDENGYFVLVYDDDKKKNGVSIGACRVTLRDLFSAYTGRNEDPIPPRFSQDYIDSNKTPLRRKVEAGVINNHVFELNSEQED